MSYEELVLTNHLVNLLIYPISILFTILSTFSFVSAILGLYPDGMLGSYPYKGMPWESEDTHSGEIGRSGIVVFSFMCIQLGILLILASK